MEDDYSEDINIKYGVRLACVLSPALFDLYSEHIFNMAVDNTDAAVLIDGERLNNVRYADDTVVFSRVLRGIDKSFR